MSNTNPLTAEQEKILGRHNSLGVALIANDLEWAHLYYEQTEERHRPMPKQLQDLFFNNIRSMEPATADWLIAQGINPEAHFEVQLPDRKEVVGLARILINNGRDELFKHLFENGTITLEHRAVGGDGLLAQALAVENVELADWLLARGAQLDEPNFLGFTALHQSANHIRFKSVEWLLSKGANPELMTIESDSVPSQLIPDNDETGDNDLLFNALEDYSEAFANGVIEVPASLKAKCDEIRSEEAAAAAPVPAGKKPRP